jgi:hypothetical protein
VAVQHAVSGAGEDVQSRRRHEPDQHPDSCRGDRRARVAVDHEHRLGEAGELLDRHLLREGCTNVCALFRRRGGQEARTGAGSWAKASAPEPVVDHSPTASGSPAGKEPVSGMDAEWPQPHGGAIHDSPVSKSGRSENKNGSGKAMTAAQGKIGATNLSAAIFRQALAMAMKVARIRGSAEYRVGAGECVFALASMATGQSRLSVL